MNVTVEPYLGNGMLQFTVTASNEFAKSEHFLYVGGLSSEQMNALVGILAMKGTWFRVAVAEKPAPPEVPKQPN